MDVVECPECGGWVPVDYKRCQTCGHYMKPEAMGPPRRVIQPSKGPLLQRRVPTKWRIVVVAAVIVFAIVITWALFTNPFGTSDVKVVVTYSHPWSGAIGDLYDIHTWGSTGSYSQTLHRTHSGTWIVTANAQKLDGSSATLTISIQTMDGRVLRSSSTSTPYGMAQVVATL